MKKRILPVLLALCMVMSLLPVTFAANITCSDTDCTKKGQEHEEGQHVYACDHEGKNCGHDGHTATYTAASKNADGLCPKCAEAAAATPEEPKDEETVYYCACKGTHEQWIDNTDPKNPAVKTTCQNKVEKEGDICATCQKAVACNPCGKGGCTLLKGHTGNHKGQTECSNDKYCTYDTHGDDCPKRCTALDDVKTVDTTTGEATQTNAKCTRTAGHSGAHNNTACINATGCGAPTHFAGKAAVEEVKDEQGNVTTPAAPAKAPCPSATAAGQCGVGGCTLPKGHLEKVHKNTTCLGYNANGTCDPNLGGQAASDAHIAGCDHYDCGCNHGQGDAEWAKIIGNQECTHKPGCPLCAAWNSYVSGLIADYNEDLAAYKVAKAAYDKLTEEEKADTTKHPVPVAPSAVTAKACDCKDCRPNPAMGAVVDAEGNVVDPAEPTTPDVPTKAEDFKDADKMDDWMKEAAQVMLDKGWMEGTTEGNFEPREDANTNVVLTVIARMSGETITGATWADDAKAWAEENELTEGIEITKSDIARKDIILMLWRLAGKPESEQALDDFTDVDGLENDYLTAMKWAVENKIVLGNGDGTVTPDGTLKRAELAALVARYAALEK